MTILWGIILLGCLVGLFYKDHSELAEATWAVASAIALFMFAILL